MIFQSFISGQDRQISPAVLRMMRDGGRAFTGNLGTSPSQARQRAHDSARVTKPGGRPGGDLGLLDRRDPGLWPFTPMRRCRRGDARGSWGVRAGKGRMSRRFRRHRLWVDPAGSPAGFPLNHRLIVAEEAIAAVIATVALGDRAVVPGVGRAVGARPAPTRRLGSGMGRCRSSLDQALPVAGLAVARGRGGRS
jgi:hypothetical protein